MSFQLDTKALQYFAAVAAHKSYTRAAISLRITQPAVTRQIQAIEREFGVRLFMRQGRHIVLTEAGQALYEQAREILERIAAAGDVVRQAARDPTGRLAIGAPTATIEGLVTRVVGSYRQKYPCVFLHWITGNTGDLAELVGTDKLDLALLFGTPSHGELELRPLMESEIGLIAPLPDRLRKDPIGERSEISLEEAAALPLISPSRAQTLRTIVDQACAQIGVTPNVTIESDSLTLSKAMVKAGLGFMFLGANSINQEWRQGELRYLKVSPTPTRWQLSIATRRTKSISLAARLMIREIVDVAHRDAAALGWEGKLLS